MVPKSLLLQDSGRMTRHQHHTLRFCTPLPGDSVCTGLPKGSIPCLWADTPILQHLLQPFPSLVSLQLRNREDNRDKVFSSKKGEEGACISAGQQCQRCGRRCFPACPEFAGLSPLLSSDILACYVYKVCLWCSPSVLTQKVRNSSSPHCFFTSFCCFPSSPHASSFSCPSLRAWAVLTVSDMSLTFMGDL